jgi:hypothetical protein
MADSLPLLAAAAAVIVIKKRRQQRDELRRRKLWCRPWLTARSSSPCYCCGMSRDGPIIYKATGITVELTKVKKRFWLKYCTCF